MRERRRILPVLPLLLCLATAQEAKAAETDPYYAWLHPPRDSTVALNRNVNRIINRAIDDVNRSWGARDRTCAEVAAAVARPLARTGMWFFVGAMDGYGLDYVPRTNTEYLEDYRPHGIYRDGFWWRLGFLVPPDPTVRVADVHLSPDKIGHFFIDGHRYYKAFHEGLGRGLSPRHAHEAVIRDIGIRAESYMQGNAISGVFSFADLEANEQGFLFYQRLCDGKEALLVEGDDGWRLREPLDFRDYVNPCWDEAHYPSSFDPRVGKGVKRAVREYCGALQEPYVRALRGGYEERGCSSFSYRYLEELAAAGAVPDPDGYSVDVICESERAPR